MRIINSGAAPIAPENLDFMRVVFGCQVKEGYGQTGTYLMNIDTTVTSGVQGV